MEQTGWSIARKILLAAGLALSHAAQADFELTGPDGRRILLKDDGTWRYVEAKDKAEDKEQAKDKVKEAGEAVLRLEAKVERAGTCRFVLRLVNNLPYQIRSFVPQFSAYRANGVIYDTVFSGFLSLKSGDSQSQEIQFRGIGCQDIARVQVGGGDRCDMGELEKFAEVKGQCLARVRVVESDLVRFDK
jgi:hypothetical protein